MATFAWSRATQLSSWSMTRTDPVSALRPAGRVLAGEGRSGAARGGAATVASRTYCLILVDRFRGSRPDQRGGGERNDERGGASRRGGSGAERGDDLGGDARVLRGGGRPHHAGAVLLIRGADRGALQSDYRHRLEWAGGVCPLRRALGRLPGAGDARCG